jgi:hypothetical protein
MAGDQRVLAGAGAAHAGQRAGHAQAGLVEPGHLAASDPITDLGEVLLQPAGSPPGYRRDRGLGIRDAEQLGRRLRGALLGQELPRVQTQADRGDPQPVLHRRLTPTGGRTTTGHSADTAARDELVLAHPHRRQLEHLPALPDEHRISPDHVR